MRTREGVFTRQFGKALVVFSAIAMALRATEGTQIEGITLLLSLAFIN
jgi:hypothetical protein